LFIEGSHTTKNTASGQKVLMEVIFYITDCW
jgi:hypothetical protein